MVYKHQCITNTELIFVKFINYLIHRHTTGSSWLFMCIVFFLVLPGIVVTQAKLHVFTRDST